MSQQARARVGAPIPLARGWSDERFERVAGVAFAVAGLVFPPNRQPSAESAMRRVMREQRLDDPSALLRAVQQPGESRDALLAALTVGESYFFRESGALSVLEREIVDTRRAAARQGEPIRIWSAGCATGEEPYTLAMLLRELGVQGDVSILGTDISRPRLDAAGRGRYTQWSLRGVSPERVTRWFRQHGKHFLVDDGIRDSVRFELLNLVSDEYPSSHNGTADQDLILCRNVLIYFDLPTVAQIAAQLLRALRPDGWLLLGASDPPLVDLVDCRMFMTPSGAVYQRADAEPRVPTQRAPWLATPVVPDFPIPDDTREIPPAPSTTAPAPAHEPIRYVSISTSTVGEAYARGDYRAAADQAERSIERGADDVPYWIVWIRSLANAGDLGRAGEVMSAAIDRHRLEPELHYLQGMLLLEGRSVAEGARAARRAIYLDRDFVMGYMLLGDALSRLADDLGARRAFENALRLLDRGTVGATVVAADGVSPERLRRIAADRLRTLGTAP